MTPPSTFDLTEKEIMEKTCTCEQQDSEKTGNSRYKCKPFWREQQDLTCNR